MFPSRDTAQRLGMLALLASTWSTPVSGLDLDLCATLNTAETPLNISMYQTNGLCHDFCINDYAYAITQGKSCWCSNYAPAKSSQEKISSCDTPCPAYPPENCGGDGLYGYLLLGKVLPSGTQAASTSDGTTTTPAITKVTETVQNTVTVTPPTTTASSSSSSSATETSSETSTITTSASLVQTVSAGGTVKTVTIGPTTTGHSASDGAEISVKSGGLSTGEVVGIVVGVIGAVIIAAGLALFFWFRRKKQRTQEEDFQDDPSIRGSSSGMMGAALPEMTMTGGSPASASAATNRNSTLQIDPRMDPFKQGLYVRSASHESINTLRDDHDYSRRIQAPKVLRATNPDPEPS